MAQGSTKKKASSVAKKAKTQKKSFGAKKGGRTIKPKKGSKTSTAVTVKEKFEVQIKQTIETTAVSQALKQEHKPLSIVKSSTATANKKNIKRKKGKGKK
ncbi:Hypothetical predicted protein [Paramuricea clavata]|uniref:Uncharacterized protein n=1 Tax=Paramuricea clavata TaxID=317549 RepID=A0A6S7J029_PARCT|nr:Hypothetical predicted protein [Paramuricea clavata]